MPLVAQFSQQGLMPAHSADLAVTGPVALPYGGPIGVGGNFDQGSLLGNSAGTPTDEVWTLAIVDGTGTVTFLFTADKIYKATFAVDADLEDVEAELQDEIFGEGNVLVTGTPGTSYTLTFAGALSEKLMGGAVSVSATTGTPTLTRTTPGTCGAGQYDVYSQASNNRVDAILQYEYGSTPQGAPVTEMRFATNQPFAPPAFTEGFFYVDDIPNLDANALTLGKLKLSLGTAITQDGAEVRLVQ